MATGTHSSAEPSQFSVSGNMVAVVNNAVRLYVFRRLSRVELTDTTIESLDEQSPTPGYWGVEEAETSETLTDNMIMGHTAEPNEWCENK